MPQLRRSSVNERRGSVAVEYAITLFVVVSLSGAVAYSQSSLFASFQASDQLFAADTSLQPHSESESLDDQPANPPLGVYAFTIASLTAFGLITMIGVRSVVRRPTSTHRNQEDDTDSMPVAKSDPRAELRDKLFDKRNSLLSAISKDMDHVLQGDFEVSHLMTTKMKTCDTNMPADQIRKMMLSKNMHHLLVCEGKKLVGVISDRDLSKSYATRAYDLMTRNPISVSPSNLLIPTISTMVNKRISCLPVTEDGELKGVLTRFDILVAFQCLLQAMSKHSSGQEDQSETQEQLVSCS